MPNDDRERMSRARAMALSGADSAFWGHLPEVSGAIAEQLAKRGAPPRLQPRQAAQGVYRRPSAMADYGDAPPMPEPMEARRQAMEEMRAGLAQARRDQPVASFIGDAIPAVATGFGGGAAAQAALGTGREVVTGFGRGEIQGPGDLLWKAGAGALPSALGAGAKQAAGRAAERLATKADDVFPAFEKADLEAMRFFRDHPHMYSSKPAAVVSSSKGTQAMRPGPRRSRSAHELPTQLGDGEWDALARDRGHFSDLADEVPVTGPPPWLVDDDHMGRLLEHAGRSRLYRRGAEQMSRLPEAPLRAGATGAAPGLERSRKRERP